MADTRSIVTAASLAVALVCVGWVIYVQKHAGRAQAFGPPAAFQGGGAGGRPPGAGGGPPGGSAPGAQVAGGGGGQPVAVVTIPVRAEALVVDIEALGTARANEAVDVTSKTSNIITAIHFRDGQQVQVGQLLVQLDNAQQNADVAAATADYTDSVSQYNRSRELAAMQALSKAQYEQLEATMKANEARVAAARAKLSDTVIRAPFSGRVGLRRVSVGTLISPGVVITTLDDTSVIKVDFSVPDVSVGALRTGLGITATSAALAARTFEGKVDSIDSRIDPSTRSVSVRALVPNRDGALKPGMFLTVQLAKEQRQALVIPEEALVPEQSKQFVFVVANGRAVKREIRIGRREPGRVEVAAGLVAGDHVVTEGTQKIRDGASVRELRQAGGSMDARGRNGEAPPVAANPPAEAAT